MGLVLAGVLDCLLGVVAGDVFVVLVVVEWGCVGLAGVAGLGYVVLVVGVGLWWVVLWKGL